MELIVLVLFEIGVYYGACAVELTERDLCLGDDFLAVLHLVDDFEEHIARHRLGGH